MKSEEELLAWLNDEKQESICLEANGTKDYFFKAPRTKHITFLFHQNSYNGNRMRRSSSFTYAGFHNKTDNSIYDADYVLKRLFPEHVRRIQIGELYCKIKTEVRKRVEERIGNDRASLSIEGLNEKNQEKLRQFERNYLCGETRKLYLYGIHSDEVNYECWYECIEGGDDEPLFQYLADSERFVREEAEKYITDFQEDILYGIEIAGMKKSALQAIEAEEDGQLQRIKRIMDAIEKSGAQAVKVTINKNGEEFTFKTSALELKRDPVSYYSTYNIAAEDRKIFEKKFGRCANYKPEEIVGITYRGKSIYSAEPYAPEQSETTGMEIRQ